MLNVLKIAAPLTAVNLKGVRWQGKTLHCRINEGKKVKWYTVIKKQNSSLICSHQNVPMRRSAGRGTAWSSRVDGANPAGKYR